MKKPGLVITNDMFKEMHVRNKYGIADMVLRLYVTNLALNSWRMRQALSVPTNQYKAILKKERIY